MPFVTNLIQKVQSSSAQQSRQAQAFRQGFQLESSDLITRGTGTGRFAGDIAAGLSSQRFAGMIQKDEASRQRITDLVTQNIRDPARRLALLQAMGLTRLNIETTAGGRTAGSVGGNTLAFLNELIAGTAVGSRAAAGAVRAVRPGFEPATKVLATTRDAARTGMGKFETYRTAQSGKLLSFSKARDVTPALRRQFNKIGFEKGKKAARQAKEKLVQNRDKLSRFAKGFKRVR